MIKERICYAVVFAVEAAIAWFYYGNIYPIKRFQPAFGMSFVFGYLLLFLLSANGKPALNILTFFCVNLTLLMFNYKCSAKAGILQAAFLTFSNGVSEVLINLILTFFHFDYNAYTYNFTVMLALGIASKLLYLVIIFLAAHIFKPQSANQNESNLTTLLGVMPAVSGFIVVTVTYIGLTSELNPVTEIMVTISMLALLIVNLAVLILYGRIQVIAAENAALSISKAQDEANVDYYILLRDQYDSQQIMIHDIRKHLGSIRDMLEIGNAVEAEHYIETLESMPSLERKVKLCDDPLLNVILSRYISWAQDIGVAFHCDIKSSDFSFMDATSITALFSNLLSNAVESAQKSEEKKVELSIVKNTEEEYIMISLENSCDIAPETDTTGNFKTTKVNQRIHGYGLKSINRVIQKYDGISLPRYDSSSKTFCYTIRFPISNES